MDNWENVISRNVWAFLSIKELSCLMFVSKQIGKVLINNDQFISRFHHFITNGIKVISFCYERLLITNEEYYRSLNYYNKLKNNLKEKKLVCFYIDNV